jgi:tRNA (guanine37-N1)-methyltransferase
MELLAGDEDYVVTLKESNANFTFNFRDVYWNSRLQTEHQRLVDFVVNLPRTHESTIVADMMAGVGPFSVPMAMAGIRVYANDLNPSSFTYLEVNAKKNKCTKTLSSFNCDGRLFIIELQRRGIDFSQVIMNLPQSAPEFLDVFIGLSRRHNDFRGSLESSVDKCVLPVIHVYAFSSSEDPVVDVAERCAGMLKCSVESLGTRIVSTASLGITGVCGSKEHKLISDAIYRDRSVVGHLVRDVAPKKMMVCLSFFLPEVVATSDPVYKCVDQEVYEILKKRKV